MSGELPEGWAATTLGGIADINPRHPKGLDDTMLVSFVPMAGLNESRPEFQFTEERPLGAVRKGFTHFADGDVLFAKITPCMENGKGAVARGLRNRLGCGTTELHVVRPLAGISPEYIYRFLAQDRIRRVAKEHFTGTAGQARVPTSFIEELTIPLAPLPEQRRIVAKPEVLLDKVNACQKRLGKIPVLLKRFRQSVLVAACSGRLTADWREENPSDETSEDYLSKVLKCRLGFWKRSTRKATCPEAALPDTSSLPDVPPGWVWIPLGILGANPFETVQTGPFGTLLHKEEFTFSGVPVIAVGNLTGMGFTKEGLYFVSDAKAEQLCRFDIQVGDVLFARSGATLGKVCVAPPDAKDWRMTGHILRARLNRDLLLPDFCVFALRGDPAVTGQVFGSVQGTTRPGYNTTLLESIALPVAPIPEQQEIVRRVGSLFTLADQIEARYAKAQAQVDKLTPSLLAKVFRGELVPQDPNDEPAPVVLERIRKETTAQAK